MTAVYFFSLRYQITYIMEILEEDIQNCQVSWDTLYVQFIHAEYIRQELMKINVRLDNVSLMNESI